MTAFTWDDKAEYLLKTRKAMFNDDYLAFLVERVWKLDRPVSMIDFGCGLGFLGMKLLPLLPEGSSYTGVDSSAKLLEEARGLFADSPYQVNFICADILETEPEDNAFDISVCQALLLHMREPKNAIKKMMGAVKPGGIVLGIEPHWNGAMASLHVHELDMLKCVDLGFLQRLYEHDSLNTGRDGNIGLKLPVYLRELGLRDVQSRLSDAVCYLHPDLEDGVKDNLYGVLVADGYTKPPRDIEGMVCRLMERGAAEPAARAEFQREKHLAEQLRDHGLDFNTVFAYHMIISWGYKP